MSHFLVSSLARPHKQPNVVWRDMVLYCRMYASDLNIILFRYWFHLTAWVNANSFVVFQLPAYNPGLCAEESCIKWLHYHFGLIIISTAYSWRIYSSIIPHLYPHPHHWLHLQNCLFQWIPIVQFHKTLIKDGLASRGSEFHLSIKYTSLDRVSIWYWCLLLSLAFV